MIEIPVVLRLTDDQLDAIAEKVAERLGSTRQSTPYTIDEAAEVLGVHRDTVSKGIDAGTIPRVPGISRKMIPAVEIERMLAGKEA